MKTLIQTDRFVLSDAERSAIEHEMHHYEDPRAASIEALKIVQKARGWVPDGAADAIGAVIGIPASDVEGVATFYSQIMSRWSHPSSSSWASASAKPARTDASPCCRSAVWVTATKRPR